MTKKCSSGTRASRCCLPSSRGFRYSCSRRWLAACRVSRASSQHRELLGERKGFVFERKNELAVRLKVRERISSHFRAPSNKGARLARREERVISRSMNDEQRSQAGCVGVLKCEVILSRALSVAQRVGASEEERRAMAKRARRYVELHHDWNRIVDATEKVYASLVKERRKGA